MHTDIFPADFAEQKWSSLRETDSIVIEIINKCWNAGIKANAGIYLSACTSFRSILLFTAAAYLITLLRLGKGLPDSILATTD